MVTGTGSVITEHWDYGQRPLPRNAKFRALNDIDTRDYDLAILHFDENVLAPEYTNGVIGAEWGAAFKLFREQIDLPKVAICHGTPQFYGQYTFDYAGTDLMQPIEAERQRLVDYLGDIHVVCNSHQAQAEWQFRRSSVIWHGSIRGTFRRQRTSAASWHRSDRWYSHARITGDTFSTSKSSPAIAIWALPPCRFLSLTQLLRRLTRTRLLNSAATSMNCADIPYISIRHFVHRCRVRVGSR